MRGCFVVIEYTPPSDTNTIFSISAAGFGPHVDGYDFENNCRYLKHFHGPGGSTDLNNGWYYAQVQLPQGVKVAGLRYHYNNTVPSGDHGSIILQRTRLGTGNFENMAEAIVPSDAQGYGNNSDVFIDYAIVDNTKYACWVIMDLPASASGVDEQTWGCSIAITWLYPIYMPVILR